ncbi:MAG: immunoglobulin domain-containing protein [Verrucomicrobiota bacterium]
MNVPVVLRRQAGGARWRGLGLALLLSHQAVRLACGAGTAAAWGDDNAGQVSQIPQGALSGVTAVAGGGSHSLALRSDGTVVAWGWDDYNQIDVPADLTNATAIAAGSLYSMALRSDGTVVVWGKPQPPPDGLSNVVAIAAGWDHSLALKSDGTIVAWGDNTHNETNVPAGLTNVVGVAAGNHFSVALRFDGTVVAWGDNSYGQTNVSAQAVNVLTLAAGGYHCLALRGDGTVVAWGRNNAGQTTVPGNLANVVEIAAGALHSLALKADGTLAGWGDNTYGQRDVGPAQANYCGLGAGDYHSLTIRGDGSPVILLPPASQTVVFGKPARFQALVVGTPPLSCQWRKNGQNIAGATTTSYVLSSIQMNDRGSFTLVISNAVGVTTSQPAVLTPVGIAPWITAQPASGTNLCGETASFQVTADGPRPLTYQWRLAGVPIPGETQPSLVVPNVSGAQAGGYSVVVANVYGSITSAVANLTVIVTPWVTNQPRDLIAYCGRDASFQVGAGGPAPLSYQWLFAGVPIAGATAPVLGLTAVTNNQAGAYSVAVACPCGSVTSALANLTILGIPLITNLPQDVMVYCGDTATFQVGATGPTPLSYQWQFQGTPIQAATNATLALVGVTNPNVGLYNVVIACPCGAMTSAAASLTISPEPPLITSPLTATALQGQPFSYTITGLHNPTRYTAVVVPPGLTLNPTNGLITGTNFENGTFYIRLGTANACAADTKTLRLDVSPGAPLVTSANTASGIAGNAFTYTITATQSPTSFSAQNLPAGVILDPMSGIISGTLAYSGEFDTTISASNPWGTGSASLHISVGYGQINGLSIVNVRTNYHCPFLLDVQFALRDDNDPAVGKPLVVDPALLSVTVFEDDQPVDPSETALILQRVLPGALKVKVNLVLDFSTSISSTAINGDSNGDGISDAIDAEISSSEQFVTQQAPSTLIGVYEFHRKDLPPNRVIGLTNATAAYNAIAGIWTNYIYGYSSGSHCWDALMAAVRGLGVANSNEFHSVVFVSDGKDDSSTNTLGAVIAAATNANVQIYCVGFGQDINTNNLQQITTTTGGTFFVGQTAVDLAGEFAQIGKVFTGLYRLRWMTPKQPTVPPFMPSFEVTYQGFTALSPTNPWSVSNYDLVTTNIDTNASPATTNYTTNSVSTNVTNYTVFSPYDPAKYACDVNLGQLHLQPSSALPSGATLYADYLPEYIRQFNLHYRLNWPGAVVPATNLTDLLYGWSVAPTDDGSNGTWLLLSSPDPVSGEGVQTTSIPWASWGELVNFYFRDQISSNTAFAFFVVDTNLYAVTNHIPGYFGQSLSNNVNGMVTNLPVLPYGTPVPWLIANGFTDPNGWTNAETADTDKDGLLNWQEYQANTNPKNPNSKFAVGRVDQSPYDGRWEITFGTALYRTYQVLASPDLVNWRIVQDSIPGTGTNITILDTGFVPSGQTFYRLMVY